MTDTAASTPHGRLGRRTLVGYVLGGATLAVAADLSLGSTAFAVVPSPPQLTDQYDLEDLQTDSAAPTSNLITITMNKDGSASFALPRTEVGQGITTSTAMIIAEELGISPEKVHVTLADARPELVYNQLTGGSNTTVSTYTPIRVAAALAKNTMLAAAAAKLGTSVSGLSLKDGVITAASGGSTSYAEMATAAASSTTRRASVQLKDASAFSVVGTSQKRLDAMAAVTGQKKFTTDMHVPGALPTMICRPPTLNGSPRQLRNRRAVLGMPGVTHVALVPTGVAVRARTFGQCIDAVRAMDVAWNKGSAEGASDESVLAELKAAELPSATPTLPAGAATIEHRFEFMFKSSAALEPYSAIADVRSDRATIWAGLKVPIVAQKKIADLLGFVNPEQVTVHVITGGGSFGHKLFPDHAVEAARISKKMGVPVKLMWHRADEPRQGRVHPMATSAIKASYLNGEVLTFEQRHTSVTTDFSHGLGDMYSQMLGNLPTPIGNQLGDLSLSQGIFTLTQQLPYNFGVVTQVLNETDERFNTGSMRNIYSPDVATANELVIDMLAKAMKKDPVAFRLEFLKDDRVKAVLQKVASAGHWGRAMPAGTAQGIAIHSEYKGATACLVEIDCRPATVNRQIYHAVTGPRVTKVVFAVDAGLVINPKGLEAQMMGGVSDGIALALTSSVHLKDGHFLEASWDNYFYTREWNAPHHFECHVMPSTSTTPGGAGEAGVASTVAAVACAYARATGKVPTRFPVNHDHLSFTPKSFIPPVPQSPTDGLDRTY